MTTRFANPPHRVVNYRREYDNNDYWDEPVGRHQARATDLRNATKTYDTPQPFDTTFMQNTTMLYDPFDPYHLPPPSKDSKPPAAWDEWEQNKNWPFPPDMPKEVLRTLKEREKKAKAALEEEFERNANWPFPNPVRRRTSSQSAPTQPRNKSRERGERRDSNTAINRPRPENQVRRERKNSTTKSKQPIPPNAPKMPEAPTPSFVHMPPPSMNSSLAAPSPLIARDSIGLIRFDLRLPYTCARKLVQGHHWTHLNHEDVKQPACSPKRTQMRIYAHTTGADWIADVRPRSREFVTVEDVLLSIYETWNLPIDPTRYARDSVNPTLRDRVNRAYKRRIERVESSRTVGYERARKAGILRVDYFGSKYLFAGIMRCYGGDGSEWWQMEVMPDT